MFRQKKYKKSTSAKDNAEVIFYEKRQKGKASENEGFNAANGKLVDMFSAGIIDPVKVERIALQNAVSVASLLITTEATVSEIKEEKPAMPAMPDMGASS